MVRHPRVEGKQELARSEKSNMKMCTTGFSKGLSVLGAYSVTTCLAIIQLLGLFPLCYGRLTYFYYS